MTDDDESLEETGTPPLHATHTSNGENINELWKKFRDRNDPDARNSLTEFFFDLVRANTENIAELIVKAAEDNDFYQAGVVGFLEALNSYDPASGISFEEYGSLAVRRAILGELRDLIGGGDFASDEGRDE